MACFEARARKLYGEAKTPHLAAKPAAQAEPGAVPATPPTA
jgi:hypothetical protein